MISIPSSEAAKKATCKGKEDCTKLVDTCKYHNGKMEMWTNNITPGIWGECIIPDSVVNPYPDIPIAADAVIGLANSIGGENNTGITPQSTPQNITATANNTAIGNVDNATADTAPASPTSAQPPAADSVTNPDATAPSQVGQSGAEGTSQDASSNREDSSESAGNNNNDNPASIVVSDDGGPQGPKDTKSCGRCL